MAARRERERRRPTERRYNFGTPEPELVDGDLGETGADTDVLESVADDDEDVPSASAGRAPASARAGSSNASASTRGGARAVARPFSSYAQEYAYVTSDLRRVATVIGGLLVALLVLYFALPILAH